ncbi:MAG: response regulator [Desulfobacterales bacterium]|nr:response regulator [Desulfobacterales bacterium]
MKKKRVLVADDAEFMRTLLPEALRIYDFDIDVVENGLEAMSHVDKKSYDLIITDYMMPGMNGLELTRRIKAKYPHTPIIVVTAIGPVLELLKCGATACIMKPFNILELQNTVKRILSEER